MRRLLMNVSSRDLSCFRLSGGIMKDAIEKAKANVAAKAEQKPDESETTTEPPLVCEKRLKYLNPLSHHSPLIDRLVLVHFRHCC